MKNESLRDEWQLRFEEFSCSEMTVGDWCRENLIPLHQFYYWRRKFAADAAPSKSDASAWLAVDVREPAPNPTAPSGVSIRLGRAVVDVSAGFDSSVLRAVVAALGAAPC
jgi:hypothetical protein